MITDTSILKSLNDYILRRIQEVPLEIKETFLETRKVWKCDSELDFLYGYYVGKIEEATLHYLLKSTRASAGGLSLIHISEPTRPLLKQERFGSVIARLTFFTDIM